MLQYIISKGHEPDVVSDNEMKRIQKYVQKAVLSSGLMDGNPGLGSISTRR